MGVAHPLSYTDKGSVLEEDEAVVRGRIGLMLEAGVQWVTCDAPFPFGGDGRRPSRAFSDFRRLVSKWSDAGLKVMAVTPYPAAFKGTFGPGLGRPGIARFLCAYEEACRFLARELEGLVRGWLVANQLNLERFRRPMSEGEAVEFLKRGGAGLKEGSPSALVGVNMFGLGPAAMRMYAALYPNDAVEFDYVGTNGFFGTFDPGGPEDWYEKTALLNEATGKPVVVQETGYPSEGETMTEAERASGRTHHELGKLPFEWRGRRTPEAQAEYLERAFWVLSNAPGVVGAVWFAWSDRPRCWNCGRADCPAGTRHGLVDLEGRPKPAYHAFRRAARGELDPRSLYPDEPAIRDAPDEALALAFASRIAEAHALRARVDVLRRILSLREASLAALRRSLAFRLYRIATWPLERLARRRRRPSSLPVRADARTQTGPIRDDA
jgi:hypothetical protein